MFKKKLAWAALAGSLVPTLAFGATNAQTVTVSTTVAQIVEMSAGTGSITIGNITAVGQTKNNNTNITVWSNDTNGVTIAVTAGDANAGVLTAGGGDTLQTDYQLTGADLAAPDGGYIGSGVFIGKSYTLNYNVARTGAYTINLAAKATAPAARAPEAGAYTCDVVLTLTGL